MSACPKCDSKNVIRADDEAPGWARQYMKCFACGNRWDLAGPPPKGKGESDEDTTEELAFDQVPHKRTGDDIVNLVMNLSRHRPPAQTKETKMKGQTCTEKRCNKEAAEDSVKCLEHRDQQRQRNVNYQRGVSPKIDPGTGKRKYTFRTRPPAGARTAVWNVPAKRPRASIVAADPTVINPRSIGNGHHSALPAIDSLIGKFEADLATLRGAKEILERS